MDGKDPEEEIEKVQAEEKAKLIVVKDFFQIFMDKHGKF